MAYRTIVDFVEDWQTGAFLLVGSVLAGVIGVAAMASLDVPYGRLVGFFGGAVVAFLAFSYLLYGR